MAKEKIFHLNRKSDNTDHLVRAARQSDAIAAVAGNRWNARVASADDIYAHFSGGGQLHPASVAEDKGTRFIYLAPANDDGTTSELVRAKNPGAAISALTDGDLTCAVVEDETLVRLLSQGVQVINVEPPQKKSAKAAGGASNDDGANSSVDAGQGGESGNANEGSESGNGGAVGSDAGANTSGADAHSNF